jgi:hypothetical protein
MYWISIWNSGKYNYVKWGAFLMLLNQAGKLGGKREDAVFRCQKKAFCTEYRIQMNKGKGGNFYARIYYKCRNNHSIFALTDKFISQNLLLVQGRQTSRTTCKITSKLIGYLIDGYERREI